VPGVTDCSQPSGCFVSESSPNSYGEGFATVGGGVWATQFDVAGILCVVLALFSIFSTHDGFMVITASGSGLYASLILGEIRRVLQS
jgi:hypothetical protein